MNVEGAVVDNVVKSEAFKNNKEQDGDEGVTNNEDEVLLSLFKTSGKKSFFKYFGKQVERHSININMYKYRDRYSDSVWTLVKPIQASLT